jgi:DNA-binding NarL/FixJ family response regulator
VLRSLAGALAAEHEVEGAAGLREALAALAARPFDLVLCDAALPGGGAERFWEEVLLRHPNVQGRVAFLAGGAEPTAVLSFLGRQPRAVLRKPPASSEVRATLEEVRAAAGAGFEARPTGRVLGRLRAGEGGDPE